LQSLINNDNSQAKIFSTKTEPTISLSIEPNSSPSCSKFLPSFKSAVVSNISKKEAPPCKQFVSHLDECFGDENLNKMKSKIKISQTKKVTDANGKESKKVKLKHSRSWDAKNSVFMSKSSSKNSHSKETKSIRANGSSNACYVATQTSSTSSNDFPSIDSVDDYSTPNNNYIRQSNCYLNSSTPSSMAFNSKIYHLDTDELFFK